MLPGRVTLSILSKFRLFSACHLSKPTRNRPIYQTICRRGVRKIVEIGIGNGQRAVKMIEVAKLASPGHCISYVGVDPFEARSKTDGPGLTLKEAHQLLQGEGGLIQLVPGNPSDAMPRIANSLGKVDLLIVPGDFDSPTWARAWFFVPRILHERSVVFVEQPGEDGAPRLAIKPREEIESLASAGRRRAA
jgi:hypothetical protein